MKQYAEYAEQKIKHICKTFGKREAGSAGEREALGFVADEVRRGGWADTLETQDFKVQPRNFMRFSKIVPIIISVGIALFAVTPIVLLAASVFSLVLVTFRFLLYRHVNIPIFLKRISRNLYAVRRARTNPEKPRRRIIFSGHIDAAYEMTLIYYMGHLVFKLVAALCVVGILFSAVLCGMIVGGVAVYQLWMHIAIVGFTPVYIGLFFFFNFFHIVDGANDNLTGTMISAGVLKYLAEHDIRFDDTEVAALITGAEESGLRGAKAFVRRNRKLLKSRDTETLFFAIETIRDEDFFTTYNRDMNGLVRLNKGAVALLDRASARVCGKAFPHGSVFPGATDAAAFAQAGIPAVALVGMNPKPSDFYHTRLDTAENLSVPCIQKAFDVSLAVLEEFDRGGVSNQTPSS